jgi:hypothetical protein
VFQNSSGILFYTRLWFCPYLISYLI